MVPGEKNTKSQVNSGIFRILVALAEVSAILMGVVTIPKGKYRMLESLHKAIGFIENYRRLNLKASKSDISAAAIFILL